MWPFRQRARPAPEPASPAPAIETLNLSDALRVLCVEKVKAEIELAGAQQELRRQELEWKRDDRNAARVRREKQREAGRTRIRRARRGADGRLLPDQPEQRKCFLCEHPGVPGFTVEQLEIHRQHGGARHDGSTVNGGAPMPELPN